MDNDAPGAPIMVSDGVLTFAGVEIRVTVDDPDGDMVALHFRATPTTGPSQDFSCATKISNSFRN